MCGSWYHNENTKRALHIKIGFYLNLLQSFAEAQL